METETATWSEFPDGGKAIVEQILAWEEINKSKRVYQSGFRTNHSADLCLTQLTDFVTTGMEKPMDTGRILVDFQKAFDTLDHGVLLEKMK